MRSQRLLVVPLALAVLLCAPPAQAQSQKDGVVLDQAAAHRLYEEAKRANVNGDIARARELFEAAYRLDPHPILRVSAANMRAKLGDFRGAAALYRALLADVTAVQAIRDQARTRLADISDKLGHAWVRFPADALAGTRAVGTETLPDSSEPIPIQSGSPVVSWVERAGTLELRHLRIESGVTETLKDEPNYSVAIIDLDPPLPTGMILQLGAFTVNVPSGTRSVRTSLRWTGQARLSLPEGASAERLIALRPGTRVRWPWSSAIAEASVEPESRAPWGWIALGAGAAIASGTAVAYMLSSGSDTGPRVDAVLTLDLSSR